MLAPKGEANGKVQDGFFREKIMTSKQEAKAREAVADLAATLMRVIDARKVGNHALITELVGGGENDDVEVVHKATAVNDAFETADMGQPFFLC